MRTNSMKVLLYKYFTPRVVILRVTNREREREKIYEVQRGVGFPKKTNKKGKTASQKRGTRALYDVTTTTT